VQIPQRVDSAECESGIYWNRAVRRRSRRRLRFRHRPGARPAIESTESVPCADSQPGAGPERDSDRPAQSPPPPPPPSHPASPEPQSLPPPSLKAAGIQPTSPFDPRTACVARALDRPMSTMPTRSTPDTTTTIKSTVVAAMRTVCLVDISPGLRRPTVTVLVDWPRKLSALSTRRQMSWTTPARVAAVLRIKSNTAASAISGTTLAPNRIGSNE